VPPWAVAVVPSLNPLERASVLENTGWSRRNMAQMVSLAGLAASALHGAVNRLHR
jgi:hypothetical protein